MYSGQDKCGKTTKYIIHLGSKTGPGLSGGYKGTSKCSDPVTKTTKYDWCGNRDGGWLNFATYPYNTNFSCYTGDTSVGGALTGYPDYYDTVLNLWGEVKDSNCSTYECQTSKNFTIAKNGKITGTIFNSDLTTSCTGAASAPLGGITVTATTAPLGAGLVWPDDAGGVYTAKTGSDGSYTISNVPIDNYNLSFTDSTGVLTPNISCASTVANPKAFFYGEANNQKDGVASVDGSFGISVTVLNYGSSNAWWQVKDGDVVTNGGIQSAVPSGSFFELPGDGGYPGIPAYGGSTNLTMANVSATGWLANSAYSPAKIFNSDYFINSIPADVVINGVTDNSPDGSFFASGGTSSYGYYWYVYDGTSTGLDLNITSAANLGSRKVILIVKGADLNIGGNISLTKGVGFFLAVTNKSINVSPSVGGGGLPNLEGIFFADGQFQTGTGGAGSDTQLWIKGAVAAGGVALQRDLGGTQNVTLTPPDNCSPDNPSCGNPIDLWTFDEGSGSVVHNSIDSSNNGNWSGTGPHWATGRYGSGGIFNGVDDYVGAGDTLNSNFTISYWYWAADNTHSGSVMGMRDHVPVIGHTSGGYFRIEVKNSDGDLVSDTSVHLPAVKTWHLVTLTRNSGKLILYVDGTAHPLFSNHSEPGGFAIFDIGKNGNENAGFFNGKLDQVKIYNYARTVAQVAWDYSAGGSETTGGSGGNSDPAELFEYDPTLIINYPGVLGSREMNWKEVAP
jgi:hypothetical protein